MSSIKEKLDCFRELLGCFRELMRSSVRVIVTFLAAGYLFIGGGFFCYYILKSGDGNAPSNLNEAKNIFMAILPISSSILAYWFAARGAEKKKNNE